MLSHANKLCLAGVGAEKASATFELAIRLPVAHACALKTCDVQLREITVSVRRDITRTLS